MHAAPPLVSRLPPLSGERGRHEVKACPERSRRGGVWQSLSRYFAEPGAGSPRTCSTCSFPGGLTATDENSGPSPPPPGSLSPTETVDPWRPQNRSGLERVNPVRRAALPLPPGGRATVSDGGGCPKVTQTLPKNYPNTAQKLPKYCPKTTQELPKHFSGAGALWRVTLSPSKGAPALHSTCHYERSLAISSANAPTFFDVGRQKAPKLVRGSCWSAP